MRVHLAVDDVRTSKLPLATRQRWEGLAVFDLRQPKTQTRSHLGIPSPSGLTGRPRHAKERRFWTPKGGAPESTCSFLHWGRGSLTFFKVSIKGGRARQRDVTHQAQRYRAVTESAEEPPSLQPRIARTLNVVSAEQLRCTLRSPKWATIDETPLKGRTLPAAPSK